MDILFELCIIQIDLFAKCRSAEVGRTVETGIAEIGVIYKPRTAKIGTSLEIAFAEIGQFAKRCITDGGINSEIGFSKDCVCKEISFAKLDQIIKHGPCKECRTRELSLFKAGIFFKLRGNEIYRVVEDRS